MPFGGVHTIGGIAPVEINLRFPGQWYQSESALHQNWMRDYDPTTGRYLQADPLGLIDGPSVYGYALQNPMTYVDPRGERGISGGTLGSSFGLRPPSVGFSVNPHNKSMSGWPQFVPRETPVPANVDEGMQCSRNSCMLRTEVTPNQLKTAGIAKGYGSSSEVKGCLYRCPGGKLKLELLSENYSCPTTISDFPGETYNDLNPSDLLKLRTAGVRY